MRQVTGWGFTKIHRTGADYGCYYHEYFLRGLPNLVSSMEREPLQRGKPGRKPTPSPGSEPNLYQVSRLHPLPPSIMPNESTMAEAYPTNVAVAGLEPLSQRIPRATLSTSSGELFFGSPTNAMMHSVLEVKPPPISNGHTGHNSTNIEIF